jgi:FAD/FMN-containing dehydrogenase
MIKGWSSTKGVQISLSRFNTITYDKETQTALVGTGMIWDDVYAALDQFNRSTLGCRVPGIGVGGCLQGGGRYHFYTGIPAELH